VPGTILYTEDAAENKSGSALTKCTFQKGPEFTNETSVRLIKPSINLGITIV